MPIFFIHVRSHDGLSEDLEGSELPNLDAAQSEALAAARDLVVDQIRTDTVSDGQLEIWDEFGHKLSTVPFRNAYKSKS
jgi:hypothetical protein